MREIKDEQVKRIKVTPVDIVTGKEVDIRREEHLISDDKIRQIIRRFAPILHKGITEAQTFFSKSIGNKYAYAVPMLEDEIELWNGLFGLESQVLEKAKKGLLFVPEVTSDDSRLLPSPEKPKPSTHSKALRIKGSGGKQFRVNLDKVVWVPILPFNPEGMKFFIKPRAHLGGRGRAYGVGDLYNAFIAIDTYVQDSLGRWTVDQIPGTGVHSWDSGPVYSPLRPVGADVWFNTTIKPNRSNSLSISVDKPEYLMLHCDVHRRDELNRLQIPDDPRLKLFFWQLDRFMRPISIGQQKRPALLGPIEQTRP